MRHCTGTYFACLDLLLEVIHRDIHPEVTIKVDDDGVDTTHGIKDGCKPVVIGNLSSILFTLKTKLLTHKLIAELLPVVLRIGDMMSIVVASSTTELGSDGCFLQGTQLLLKAIDIDHHLLTETCRRCGLSMSLGQHGHVTPLFGIVVKLFDQLLDEGIINVGKCFLDTKGYGSIVNILRGKSEMDELFGLSGEATQRITTLLDEILNSLHIMVSDTLNGLHTKSILCRKVTIDVAERFKETLIKTFKLGKRQFTKRNEILYLYTDTITYQGVFRKVSCQSISLSTIATINRRDGGQFI